MKTRPLLKHPLLLSVSKNGGDKGHTYYGEGRLDNEMAAVNIPAGNHLFYKGSVNMQCNVPVMFSSFLLVPRM